MSLEKDNEEINAHEGIQKLLSGEIGQALLQAGLLTAENAQYLGEDFLAVLVTDEGRKLLEGDNPRLILANVCDKMSMLESEQNLDEAARFGYAERMIEVMIKIADISWDDAIELDSLQVKGLIWGLTVEQVVDNEFCDSTIPRMNALMARDPLFTKEQAFNQAKSPDFDKVMSLNSNQVLVLDSGLPEEKYNSEVFSSNFAIIMKSRVGGGNNDVPTIEDADKYANIFSKDQISALQNGVSLNTVQHPSFPLIAKRVQHEAERNGCSLKDAFRAVVKSFQYGSSVPPSSYQSEKRPKSKLSQCNEGVKKEGKGSFLG